MSEARQRQEVEERVLHVAHHYRMRQKIALHLLPTANQYGLKELMGQAAQLVALSARGRSGASLSDDLMGDWVARERAAEAAIERFACFVESVRALVHLTPPGARLGAGQIDRILMPAGGRDLLGEAPDATREWLSLVAAPFGRTEQQLLSHFQQALLDRYVSPHVQLGRFLTERIPDVSPALGARLGGDQRGDALEGYAEVAAAVARNLRRRAQDIRGFPTGHHPATRGRPAPEVTPWRPIQLGQIKAFPDPVPVSRTAPDPTPVPMVLPQLEAAPAWKPRKKLWNALDFQTIPAARAQATESSPSMSDDDDVSLQPERAPAASAQRSSAPPPADQPRSAPTVMRRSVQEPDAVTLAAQPVVRTPVADTAEPGAAPEKRRRLRLTGRVPAPDGAGRPATDAAARRAERVARREARVRARAARQGAPGAPGPGTPGASGAGTPGTRAQGTRATARAAAPQRPEAAPIRRETRRQKAGRIAFRTSQSAKPPDKSAVSPPSPGTGRAEAFQQSDPVAPKSTRQVVSSRRQRRTPSEASSAAAAVLHFTSRRARTARHLRRSPKLLAVFENIRTDDGLGQFIAVAWSLLDVSEAHMAGVPGALGENWRALHQLLHARLFRFVALRELLHGLLKDRGSRIRARTPVNTAQIEAWDAWVPVLNAVASDGGASHVADVRRHFLVEVVTPFVQLGQLITEATPIEAPTLVAAIQASAKKARLPGLDGRVVGTNANQAATAFAHDYKHIALYQLSESDFDYQKAVVCRSVPAAEIFRDVPPPTAVAGRVCRVPEPLFISRNDATYPARVLVVASG